MKKTARITLLSLAISTFAPCQLARADEDCWTLEIVTMYGTDHPPRYDCSDVIGTPAAFSEAQAESYGSFCDGEGEAKDQVGTPCEAQRKNAVGDGFFILIYDNSCGCGEAEITAAAWIEGCANIIDDDAAAAALGYQQVVCTVLDQNVVAGLEKSIGETSKHRLGNFGIAISGISGSLTISPGLGAGPYCDEAMDGSNGLECTNHFSVKFHARAYVSAWADTNASVDFYTQLAHCKPEMSGGSQAITSIGRCPDPTACESQ